MAIRQESNGGAAATSEQVDTNQNKLTPTKIVMLSRQYSTIVHYATCSRRHEAAVGTFCLERPKRESSSAVLQYIVGCVVGTAAAHHMCIALRNMCMCAL